MNKKLFLKLGISTLVMASSLSFVACGEKSNVSGVINPPNLNINESDSLTENSIIENEKAPDSTEVKKEEIKEKTESPKTEQKAENSKPKTESSKPKVEQNIENEKPKTEETIEDTGKRPNQNSEEYYYNTIKEVRQKQIDYINSIEDPHIKQSVQSSLGAAISQATSLELQNPEDSEIINAALQRVLNGN